MVVVKSRKDLLLLAFATCMINLATAVTGQSLNFVVQNDLSPREIYVSSRQGTGGAPANSNAATQAALSSQQNRFNSVGFSNYSLQYGGDNFSGAYTNNSPGSSVAAIQYGQSNSAVALIEDSPGSVVAQFQLGSDLSSDVFIIRGQNNNVATAQLGNSLGISFGLVDSTETTVVYGQAGENYSGGIVVRNAPPGTVIRLK